MTNETTRAAEQAANLAVDRVVGMIDKIIERRLKNLSILDLQKCQDQLAALTFEFKQMAQKYELANSVSRMRGDELERMSNVNDQLKQELVNMNAQLALMRSALKNIQEGIDNGE
jgi:hypothetical protein